MSTRIFRVGMALLLALSVLGMSTSTAFAGQPVRYEFEDWVIEMDDVDLCGFPIHQDALVSGIELDHFDQNGALVRVYIHQSEQDTFTANGKTLVSLPYTYNLEILFDEEENITHVWGDGLVVKIPLPDGSLFVTAGRSDSWARNAPIILVPDKGSQGNLEAFCDALAPNPL